MKATDLFNSRRKEFETSETFAKRVYETAKKCRSSLRFTPEESYHILQILADYYKESVSNIISVIQDIQWKNPSQNYNIRWTRYKTTRYLIVNER